MKYTLTKYELELVSNPEVLVTKNIIIKKVYEMFGSLSETYRKQVSSLPEEFISAKISRGENYLGLPYVMLDYPRQFGKPDIFAIRTFFWWGNFFSITLLLAGAYQNEYAPKLQKSFSQGLLDKWFITFSANAWHHQFDDGYYAPITKSNKYELDKLPFIKVATKISLNNWDEAEEFLLGNFSLIMKSLY